ncbi:hypothetical protein K6119_17005 [Paracrocinitomix mangrovi]|uniref:hypothetical protein n=1 Tax=Paracrocinitomix mangrovi TaxID=2862509 RepID=UPI001C8D8D60|nr:hypothetical protein [Paracrocinitomix mangrovi]UKN01426.1 hypothetical protein K6119_17005 [Paracrocinitomix mangrovi]
MIDYKSFSVDMAGQIHSKSNENWESKTTVKENGDVLEGEEAETIDCTIEELNNKGDKQAAQYQKGKK